MTTENRKQKTEKGKQKTENMHHILNSGETDENMKTDKQTNMDHTLNRPKLFVEHLLRHNFSFVGGGFEGERM